MAAGAGMNGVAMRPGPSACARSQRSGTGIQEVFRHGPVAIVLQDIRQVLLGAWNAQLYGQQQDLETNVIAVYDFQNNGIYHIHILPSPKSIVPASSFAFLFPTPVAVDQPCGADDQMLDLGQPSHLVGDKAVFIPDTLVGTLCQQPALVPATHGALMTLAVT